MTDPQEHRRRLARERKREQRKRDRRFGVKTFPLPLAAVQRADLRHAATAAGYQDQGEYLIHLLNCDLSRMGMERCKPEDLGAAE